MAQQGVRKRPDALTVLTLLVAEAPPARIESLLAEAACGGAPEAETAALERAVRLGLDICAQRRGRQQREAGLSALLDTARDLLVPDTLDEVLKAVTRRSRLLLGADMAYVSFPGPEDGLSYIRASDGHTSTLNVGLQLTGGSGLGHAAVANLAPVWTPDYLDDNRIQHSTDIDEVVRTEGLRAIMAVPLSYGPHPFGALYVADRNVRHYTPEEISTANLLGELAGLAVQRTLVLDDAKATVQTLREEHGRTTESLRELSEHRRIHHELIERALTDCELHGLAEAVSRNLGGALRIHAADGTVLTTTGRMPETGPAAAEVHAAKRPVHTADGLWAAPVTAGGEILGTLVFRPEDLPAAGIDELLHLAAQAVAVQLLRTGDTAVVQGRAHGELLEDLLTSAQRPPQQLEERARRLGINLATPHVVVVVRPEARAVGRACALATGLAQRLNGLRVGHGGNAVLLLPGTDAGATARAVLNELAPLLSDPVTVAAAGPVADAASVFHCHQEALRCLEAMIALDTTGRSASPRELGFLGVLLADNRDVRSFVDSVIGPVLEYDRQRFTDLGRTLDAYFETGASPTRAAQKLHVHPNTVARRLERIAELLGPDWQDPGQALEVQLALRLSRVRDLLIKDGPSAGVDQGT
ncbi:helix-turn-helix domain-containing protein [Kitasatospora sp. NPDC056731]|uniref:helix-turn-helix domain-containing protein n=1 Tax=Kitasatospora sp. NPDC056731 TaxID=3155422 RepID=UPI0034366520